MARAGLARRVLSSTRSLTALLVGSGAWLGSVARVRTRSVAKTDQWCGISDSLLRGKRLPIEFVFSGLTLRFDDPIVGAYLSKRANNWTAKNASAQTLASNRFCISSACSLRVPARSFLLANGQMSHDHAGAARAARSTRRTAMVVGSAPG